MQSSINNLLYPDKGLGSSSFFMHTVASVPIKLARRSRKNKQRSLIGNRVKLRIATWNENIVKQKN